MSQLKKKQVIYSKAEAEDGNGLCFWSNNLGWCILGLATRFDRDERLKLRLPLTGAWMGLTDARKLALKYRKLGGG